MGNTNLSLSLERIAKNIKQKIDELKEFERKVANVRINFIYYAKKEEMPFGAIEILKIVAAQTDNTELNITSTFRTHYDQARIMYEAVKTAGMEANRRLYGFKGNLMLDLYEKHKNDSKEVAINAMKGVLDREGHDGFDHCDTNEKAFDISLKNLKNASKFNELLLLEVRRTKVETRHNCIHVVK